MKPSSLLTITFAAALLGVGVAGCSEPDVASFAGSGAQLSADSDDDDDDRDEDTDEDDGDTTAGKDEGKAKSDDEDAPADPTETDTEVTEPTKKRSQAECFTNCVKPVPEAFELDACSNRCPDGDAECLSDCYDSSSCGSNPQCDQAIAQCGQKCPADE